MAQIEIKDPNTNKTISYYMHDRLKKNIDEKIKGSLIKKDKDYVLVIDGMEGSGKSTFAFQIGKYVDNTLNINRICFDAESFREAIYKAKKGQCIIYDEAFTGLSSRSSLSGVNRMLVSLMMQMRQKNLFIIIVLPTFFLLDKYVAIFRARTLLHVYESGGRRGYFKVYNQKLKKLLFLKGKLTYEYHPKKIRVKFRGRFYGVFALGDDKVEVEYKKKKERALKDTENTTINASSIKYRTQRDLCIYLLRKETKMTYKQLSQLLDDSDFKVSFQQVRNICSKFGDMGGEEGSNSNSN